VDPLTSPTPDVVVQGSLTDSEFCWRGHPSSQVCVLPAYAPFAVDGYQRERSRALIARSKKVGDRSARRPAQQQFPVDGPTEWASL
jgi:hypothetical protein